MLSPTLNDSKCFVIGSRKSSANKSIFLNRKLSRQGSSKTRRAKLRRSINLSTTKNSDFSKMLKIRKKSAKGSIKTNSKSTLHKSIYKRYGC